jgi:hypothetical protein
MLSGEGPVTVVYSLTATSQSFLQNLPVMRLVTGMPAEGNATKVARQLPASVGWDARRAGR